MAELSPERRLLVAFALTFLVLAAWSAYIKNRYPQTEPLPVENPPSVAEPAALPGRPSPPPVQQQQPIEVSKAPATAEVRQGSEEHALMVETDVAMIMLSTRGAVVTSWRLKDYRNEEGRPLELVQGRQTRQGFPLSLVLADPQQEESLNTALYLVDSSAAELRAPAELVFTWSDGTVSARKRIRFEQDYLAEIETEVHAGGQPVQHSVAWRGGFGADSNSSMVAGGTQAQVFVRPPTGRQAQPANQAGQETGWLWKSPSPFPFTGPASYAGIEDRYFAAVFLPREAQLSARAWTNQWVPTGEENEQAVGSVAVGVPNGNALYLYVGPKVIELLEELVPPAFADGRRPDMADELVDFGWFWWVAKPLFVAMQWMHENWVANYGWVIVLLTIIITTVLFPLRWKSMESAWKMQKVAPQVKAIQARYKQYKFNDPRKQQMQQEIMALYKQHGVNPVGGCLPLLLQMPFFFGFYKVLLTAIELRQAPWVLWIRDLSEKDPYYILPIVMALTMYLSTRMTPMTTADPTQQRLMRLMPLMFGFLFLQVSSGLVLYWMTSNVVGIAQQWWLNKRQREREATEKQAAREHKKKKRKRE